MFGAVTRAEPTGGNGVSGLACAARPRASGMLGGSTAVDGRSACLPDETTGTGVVGGAGGVDVDGAGVRGRARDGSTGGTIRIGVVATSTIAASTPLRAGRAGARGAIIGRGGAIRARGGATARADGWWSE